MGNIINRLSDPDRPENRSNSLEAYSNIGNIGSANTNIPVDFTTPLNFSDWSKYQSSIDPNNQYALYLQYVINWYNNKVPQDVTSSVLQSSYLSVLKSLALSFRDDIQEEWVRDLQFTNDIDVQDSIEFYSRKLKEIAIYYINKRKTAKNAKLKYNLVGTNRGLEELFEDYILKAFTQREYVLNTETSDVYNNLPELSAITDSAKITVSPYYDLTPYYDKSPTVPVTSYFNPQDNTEWLQDQNITIDVEDLFETGILSPLYNSDPITAATSLSAISDTTNQVSYDEILRQITEKFTSVAADRLQVSQTLNNTITTTYDIAAGNNWFYWPTGEYVFEQDDLDITSIPLNGTQLVNDGATANTTYDSADRIFVTNTSTNETNAAWLKLTDQQSTVDSMSAEINPNTSLTFKFPYPGYGEAAPNLAWTGPSLTNINSIYNYSNSEIRGIIEQQYFNDTQALTGINITPINVNNAQVVYQGAKSGKKYATADKVTRRVTPNSDRVHDVNPNSVYNAEFDHSWLYDFTHTNLSLAPGQTRILWPYIKNPEQNTITFTISSDTCNTIELSSLLPSKGILGATAGQGLYDSDIIYKLENLFTNPTECAFLSGHALSAVGLPSTRFTDKIIGTYQPGLYIQCQPGIYSTFLWCGADETTLESINVKYHQPAKDSEFLNIEQTSIYNDRKLSIEQINDNSVIAATRQFEDFGTGAGVGNWKTEQYRTPLFSPIGHPGSDLDEFDKMSDIVFLDWQYPEPFSFETWRDDQGRDYKTSPDFAWYQLSANPTHPDVGFGPGSWVGYNGEKDQFKLKQGYQYKYLRARLGRNDAEIQNNDVPYIIVKHQYADSDQYSRWVPCSPQNDGTWLPSASGDSQMILSPGDTFLYDHAETTTYCVSTVDNRGFATLNFTNSFASTTGVNSFWTSYFSAPTGTTISFNWPNTVYDTSISDFTTQADLSAISWSIKSPSNTFFTFDNRAATLGISFLADEIGTYQVSAQGNPNDGGYETPVFEVDAVDTTFAQVATGSIEYGTINYSNIAINMCVGLSGWNSTTTQFDGSNYNAAKPFWAVAYDTNDVQTKNKGTSIYGTNLGFTDQYNVRTQPDISEWSYETGDTIEYQNTGNERIVWIEEIQFETDDNTIEWKRLDISEVTNPLDVFMCESADQLVISATDIASDINLNPYTDTCRGNIFINYFSQNDFTWTQILSTEFTGSINIVNSSVDSTPVAPWANLTNRHYPTIATVQDVSNIVPVQNVGMFKPNLLGFSTFLTKSHTQTLSTTLEALGTYRDISLYETDYGFTLERNESIVDFQIFDAQWMKYDITTMQRAGEIINPTRYLKFMPYVCAGEFKLTDNSTIDFALDPWSGATDSEWADDDYPPDYRGLNTISTWYNENTPPSGIIYQYGDDVFGNRYYLYKNVTTEDLYEQKTINGELWVKTIDGEIGPATRLMKEVFDNYLGRSYYNNLINGEIHNIYCFADVLIFVLENVVLFERIQYNYSSKTIFSIVDDSKTIDTSNATFGDIHADLINKRIYVSVTNNDTVFDIYRFDINTKELIQSFPATRTANRSLLAPVTALSGIYDAPLLAYNENTENYNVSLFTNITAGASNVVTTQHLISVNLHELAETYFDIKSVDIVSPNS